MPRILFRYFIKETCLLSLGIVLGLLVIFISSEFAHYLTMAANGRIPAELIGYLMLLEIPKLLGLLLPLAFFLALLVNYGRLGAEQELTVMRASGLSRYQLLGMTVLQALLVMLLVAGIMMWWAPYVAKRKEVLIREGQAASIVNTIIPGRFQKMGSAKTVLYVEQVDRDKDAAKNVFLAKQDPKQPLNWQVINAKTAQVNVDHKGQETVVLHDGNRYLGQPGQANFQVMHFARYIYHLPTPKIIWRFDEEALATSSLWPIDNANPTKAGELQWRLSVPLMVLVLALLAVPLSRVEPRQGRYAKLAPALILYIFYANGLFVARNWVGNGKVSPLIGMWWLHLLFLVIAFGLWWWPTLRGQSR
jgi:lipopolysaccharide export system permease protein